MAKKLNRALAPISFCHPALDTVHFLCASELARSIGDKLVLHFRLPSPFMRSISGTMAATDPCQTPKLHSFPHVLVQESLSIKPPPKWLDQGNYIRQTVRKSSQR